MTTDNLYNRDDVRQMLEDSGVDYQFDSDEPGIVYADGTRQTFEQARKLFKQNLISVAFSYKGVLD